MLLDYSLGIALETICSLEKSKTTVWGQVFASYKRGLQRELLHALQIPVFTTEALLFGFSFIAIHHTKTAMQNKMKRLRDRECHKLNSLQQSKYILNHFTG